MSHYPAYVERMLVGSAVLWSGVPTKSEEVLGVLRLSDCLETLLFCTSDGGVKELDLKKVTQVLISEFVDLQLDNHTSVRLEFPDDKIAADWSYGLQVLTVENQNISDLLEEATELNAKLLEENARLQDALDMRDDLIRQLISKIERPARILTDWEPVPKETVDEVRSARHWTSRDA